MGDCIDGIYLLLTLIENVKGHGYVCPLLTGCPRIVIPNLFRNLIPFNTLEIKGF